MFGAKKKGNKVVGNNQMTEVPDLDFDDLVTLGLIDQGLALSIQDYLEEEEASETEKPPVENPEPVLPEEKEESLPAKEAQEGKAAEVPLPQLKVVESPKQIVLPPLEGAAALPPESIPSCHPGDPVKLNVHLTENKSAKQLNVQQELTEILLDAKRYAKEERYRADEDAERILAKAKREAHLIEIEAQQRKEVLQKEYVEEVDKLLHRVDRTMEYFSVLQANTNQLFNDFLTKSEELAKQLKDKGGAGMKQKSKRYRQLQNSYWFYHFGSIMIVLLCILLAALFYFTDIRYTIGLLHLALIAFLLMLAIYFRMAANETRQVLGQQEFIAILLNTWLKKRKGKK